MPHVPRGPVCVCRMRGRMHHLPVAEPQLLCGVFLLHARFRNACLLHFVARDSSYYHATGVFSYCFQREQHGVGTVKSVKCPHCEYVSTRKTNLRVHMKTHSSEKKEIPCTECDMVFSSMNNMRRHLRKQHKKSVGVLRGPRKPQVSSNNNCPRKRVRRQKKCSVSESMVISLADASDDLATLKNQKPSCSAGSRRSRGSDIRAAKGKCISDRNLEKDRQLPSITREPLDLTNLGKRLRLDVSSTNPPDNLEDEHLSLSDNSSCTDRIDIQPSFELKCSATLGTECNEAPSESLSNATVHDTHGGVVAPPQAVHANRLDGQLTGRSHTEFSTFSLGENHLHGVHVSTAHIHRHQPDSYEPDKTCPETHVGPHIAYPDGPCLAVLPDAPREATLSDLLDHWKDDELNQLTFTSSCDNVTFSQRALPSDSDDEDIDINLLSDPDDLWLIPLHSSFDRTSNAHGKYSTCYCSTVECSFDGLPSVKGKHVASERVLLARRGRVGDATVGARKLNKCLVPRGDKFTPQRALSAASADHVAETCFRQYQAGWSCGNLQAGVQDEMHICWLIFSPFCCAHVHAISPHISKRLCASPSCALLSWVNVCQTRLRNDCRYYLSPMVRLLRQVT